MKLLNLAAAAVVAAGIATAAIADEPAYMANDWLAHDTVLEYQKGIRYSKGFEYDKAFTHYMTSAKRGYPLAMRAVGILYANGNGVEQDDIEAYKWLMLSGEGIDRHNAAMLARDMTPEQLAEAERRISEWQPVID